MDTPGIITPPTPARWHRPGFGDRILNPGAGESLGGLRKQLHEPVVGSNQEKIRALFGNAVQNNMAVQIINPIPPAETVAPDYNGRRAVGAVERYRADRVTPPATTTITTLGGGGGAGTGGGASAPSGGPPQ